MDFYTQVFNYLNFRIENIFVQAILRNTDREPSARHRQSLENIDIIAFNGEIISAGET